MADISQNASGPPGESKPWGMPPKRRGMSFGCQIVLVVCGLLALTVIALVISTYNAVQWMQQGVEATPTQYPAVELAPAEEMDLVSHQVTFDRAQRNGNDFDATFTPKLFNEFLRREAKKKKEAWENDPFEGGDVTFLDDGIKFRATWKDPNNQYVNLIVTGDFAIEEGIVRARLDTLKLAGRDAPWVAMWIARKALSAAESGQFTKNGKPDPHYERFKKMFKLLKREGDKIHVILDGDALKESWQERTSGADGSTGAGAQAPSE